MKKEKLTRYAINRLKGLMASNVKLLRVFPYESRTTECIADTDYANCIIQKDSLLYKRLVEIRKYAEKYNLNDNKIVIQVQVNCNGYSAMLFLGYWDSWYSIGTAVIPSLYASKDFPKMNNLSCSPGMIVNF